MDTFILIALAVLIFMVGVLGWRIWRGRDQTGISSEATKTELQAALERNSEQFLTLANERLKRESQANSSDLDTKKQLIDQRLDQMNQALDKVTSLVDRVEKEREKGFAELGTQLKHFSEQTVALTASTATLREALASSRVRGQWGERMADDILRIMGFQEGINYQKQTALEGGSQPDFVFPLPGNLTMNMDVKFPLDNYLNYLQAPSEKDREEYKATFLRDVRGRIMELTGRGYIDPAGGTVDFVLLFIPNESVFTFVHEQDHTLLEFGLKNRVICCSPLTIFAILVIIRQSVENFALKKAEGEVISLFGRFKEEWDKFKKSMDNLGKRMASAQKTYDQLNGPRRRALERPLVLIEDIRQNRHLPVAEIQIPSFARAFQEDEEAEDPGEEVDEGKP